MEVKIGVQHSPRELVIDSPKSPDEIASDVVAAMSGSTKDGLLTLVDERGRKVLVHVDRIVATPGCPDRHPDRQGTDPDMDGPRGRVVQAKSAREVPSLAPGDRVVHDSFGMGTVVAVEGQGEKASASIDFGSEGVKRLLLRYAPVEKL